MDDVQTLLHDSGLSHSYWAKAAAYSINTHNLIPSQRHPEQVPLESFTGKRQSVAHLWVFGAKCWAKIPIVYGGSKLDPRSTECQLLGYESGNGNYKVQDIASHQVFISHDVVFEEGQPHHTLASVGEQIPIFETDIVQPPADTNVPPPAINDQPTFNQLTNQPILNHPTIPVEPRQSAQVPQPSKAGLDSAEYQRHKMTGKGEGQDWATTVINCPEDDKNVIACITETKAFHHIPGSYKHAMTTDPERWMAPMKIEMDTLKSKHTWDLVKPPSGANIMESMWIFNIKWDSEGNQIKDKARLVGKGYTQQLGIDYNETWAGVMRLELVQMTAAVTAKLDLKLWRIDFIRAYLNSLTKEDIYMKQPEGFVETGYEDYVCKLVT